MGNHPVRQRLSTAVGADLVLAAGALGVALVGASSTFEARAASAIAIGWAVHAAVRVARSQVVSFRVDEGAGTVWIGDHEAPIERVAVGPQHPDRSFRVYVLSDDRLRTYDVDPERVVDAQGLWWVLDTKGAKVTVLHAERGDLPPTLQKLSGGLMFLLAIAMYGFRISRPNDAALAVLLLAGIPWALSLLDAWGVVGPPLLVDTARGRIWWRGWHATSSVKLLPPRVSQLGGFDLVLSLSGNELRVGRGWPNNMPMRESIKKLLGVS